MNTAAAGFTGEARRAHMNRNRILLDLPMPPGPKSPKNLCQNSIKDNNEELKNPLLECMDNDLVKA